MRKVERFGPDSLIGSGFDRLISEIEADHGEVIPSGEDFTDQVLKDEKGKSVINHLVHKEFHWFLEEAVEAGHNRVMILGAFLLGKTDQMAIGYVLERIAKDLNIRVKVISNTEDFATDRVRAVRRYIDADDEFREMCPHVKPTRIWGDSKFIISRKSASKDATIESFGMFGTAVGSRAELLLFDDPQDWRTAVTEPTTREKCKEVIENVWLPRLTEDGIALLLMNRWHEKDVPGWIKEKKEWAWMEVAISEDYRKLEVTRQIKGKIEKYSIPSWKPPEFYMRLRADMGERNYTRSCRLIPFADSELYFPSFENCVIYGHDPIEFGRNFLDKHNCLVVTGIDYSSSKRPGTILFTVAMDKSSERRIPLDIVALKDPAKLPEHMVRVWREYGVNLFYAENNATQSVINDLLLNFAGFGNLPIEGFHTGKNKADPDMGIISLEKEFENKMWTFALPRKPEAGDDRDYIWARAYYEIRDYPFWEPNDIAMSLWFCREGINWLVRKAPRPVVY
jgi:hypothetical protein